MGVDLSSFYFEPFTKSKEKRDLGENKIVKDKHNICILEF